MYLDGTYSHVACCSADAAWVVGAVSVLGESALVSGLGACGVCLTALPKMQPQLECIYTHEASHIYAPLPVEWACGRLGSLAPNVCTQA